MSIGLLFWVLMILSLILGFFANRPAPTTPDGRWAWAPVGYGLLLFILLFLLGWRVFGFVVHE